uniref:Uncharacterized protein n=1 Tax=Schistocephalus solidus TaxID=70667 RepID=A0A0X3P6D6_SCHSO
MWFDSSRFIGMMVSLAIPSVGSPYICRLDLLGKKCTFILGGPQSFTMAHSTNPESVELNDAALGTLVIKSNVPYILASCVTEMLLGGCSAKVIETSKAVNSSGTMTYKCCT